MRISIITVVFNNKKNIVGAVDSVLSQTYKNVEYILIDGASTDGTNEVIVDRLPKISKYVSEKDAGIYDAINKGIRLSTGDVIGLMHSDDMYAHEGVLEYIAKKFDEDKNLDLISGSSVFLNKNGEGNNRLYKSKNFKCWMLRFGFMPSHTASFVRKKCYDSLGLYNIKYKIAADFDWFCRLYRARIYKMKMLDELLIYMRLGGVSSSGLKSAFHITCELREILSENQINSNYFFLLMRLPIKFISKFFLRRIN
jgi:glycosyltransferase involved in cell wall biosynthesis